MTGFLHGETGALNGFALQPPAPVTRKGGGAAAGGGMPSGMKFAQAEAKSAEALEKFMTDLGKGFTEYTQIAKDVARIYENHDGAGANKIAQAQNFVHPALDGGPRRLLNDEAKRLYTKGLSDAG